MSTGISISSINRIKELAEEKKFAEALEILDTQNLDKSINPQFLRISGEIFRENKRYYDSRKYLLKAHQMSPQGTRIIYELIQLYLELGYYTKAQKYYEQYMFYAAPEDIQKDYVEYMMKKSQGADVKDIAAILIPILEMMPEDRWNFEAVLLYDKMDRKDKALEECQYILENFKDSIYTQSVIEYIDDKLDVDQHFYCYPKEEQTEDLEMFGELITQEAALLEADYLRMYPPEARIMVEADDKEGIDVKPVKEKKKKKRKKQADDTIENVDIQENSSENKEIKKEVEPAKDQPEDSKKEVADTVQENDLQQDSVPEEETAEEEQRKEEREAALEKILAKTVDREQIRETAKHVAQSVKDIDTTKAKEQVKNVAEALKGNVAKATEALGEAVAAKVSSNMEPVEKFSDEFVDGIIESVLEPPKKAVGQVVMNEELDALIPDSLEAMSAQEVADIEAKREEEERMELEALEASIRLEEEKKEARLRKKKRKDQHDTSEDVQEGQPVVDIPEDTVVQPGVMAEKIATVSYEDLKARFLESTQEEEQPLESLGFMSVVQSDVDNQMKNDIPQEAEILHQMIDNKEYYSGEDSTGFESKASYEKDDFEVEDYAFDTYVEPVRNKTNDEHATSEPLVVEEIYIEEPVVDFDEIIPSVVIQSKEHMEEQTQFGEVISGEPIEEAVTEEIIPDEVVPQELVEEAVTEETIPEEPTEEAVTEEIIPDEVVLQELVEEVVTEETIPEEPTEEAVTEEIIPDEVVPQELVEEAVTEEVIPEEPMVEEVTEESHSSVQPETNWQEEDIQQPKDDGQDRSKLRVRIILTDSMIRKLSVLKESRC